MDWVSIGKRIRTQREYLGYTREVLAEKLEITPKFCSDIELGIKGMSVPTLCRISNVLNLSVDYILFGTDSLDNDDSMYRMFKQCPLEKQKYLVDIIKAFILSANEETEKK